MVTAAIVTVSLGVVVVVVVVTVAMRRAWYQVVCRVKVAEWKSNYFVRLDPAAVVKLEPLQMYYLQYKSTPQQYFMFTSNYSDMQNSVNVNTTLCLVKK